MRKTIEPEFDKDWKKALLFVALVAKGLPPWASGSEGWKALAVLTGWSRERCLSALEEAERRGMIRKAETEDDSFAA